MPIHWFTCDPPYFGTTGYGMVFDMAQYIKMAEIARTMKGKMMVSVNDIPEMRAIFADFHIESIAIKYSRGKIYLGGVTSGQSAAPASAANNSSMNAYVYSFDVTTGVFNATPVFIMSSNCSLAISICGAWYLDQAFWQTCLSNASPILSQKDYVKTNPLFKTTNCIN